MLFSSASDHFLAPNENVYADSVVPFAHFGMNSIGSGCNNSLETVIHSSLKAKPFKILVSQFRTFSLKIGLLQNFSSFLKKKVKLLQFFLHYFESLFICEVGGAKTL